MKREQLIISNEQERLQRKDSSRVLEGRGMKPLTIDELKSLEPGEWVWVIHKIRGERYCKIKDNSDSEGIYLCIGEKGFTDLWFFTDYGTKWLAYKNKEQAECKGEIVELPCVRETLSNGAKWELVYLNKYSQIVTETLDIDELEEAERRLAELKGEE